MARTTTKKVGIFNFSNWPEKAVRPSLTDHSASVVGNFMGTLNSESTARVFSLEVSSEAIALVRRKRKAPVDETFIVVFDVGGSRATEASLAHVLSQSSNREYLREIVEFASGRPGFDAKFAGKMIANAVFAKSLGI